MVNKFEENLLANYANFLFAAWSKLIEISNFWSQSIQFIENLLRYMKESKGDVCYWLTTSLLVYFALVEKTLIAV